jgi:hypothetical protein
VIIAVPEPDTFTVTVEVVTPVVGFNTSFLPEIVNLALLEVQAATLSVPE